MTEKKFKLKKDGKCVGYMKIEDGCVLTSMPANSPDVRYWAGYEPSDCESGYIDFDSIHDFICPDRNGKEVYCDDWVWFVFGSNDRVKVQVGWDDYRKQYRMFDRQAGSTVWYEFDSFHPIELIEEQP